MLLRRVYLDLIGLLRRRRAQVNAFLADTFVEPPTAASVDELLASPRFGEKCRPAGDLDPP